MDLCHALDNSIFCKSQRADRYQDKQKQKAQEIKIQMGTEIRIQETRFLM